MTLDRLFDYENVKRPEKCRGGVCLQRSLSDRAKQSLALSGNAGQLRGNRRRSVTSVKAEGLFRNARADNKRTSSEQFAHLTT
jgi:hypothetical protein